MVLIFTVGCWLLVTVTGFVFRVTWWRSDQSATPILHFAPRNT